MKHKLQECALILRQLTQELGVDETSVTVNNLEELYEYCANLEEPRLLERLVISGHDSRGHRRALTFTFQSVSEQNNV